MVNLELALELRMRALELIGKAYKFVALNLLGAIILFVAINTAASVYLAFCTKPAIPAIREKYDELVFKAYTNQTADQTAQLLKETWTRQFKYAPYTMFRESACKGRFVNVHEKGFRSNKGQTSFHHWPPTSDEKYKNVFVFGGSTVFGYGLPDWESIPARIEYHLTAAGRKVRVYNFGTGSFTSFQESVLFQQLLAEGAVPDFAIFINGLNDFYYREGMPEFNERFRNAFVPPSESKIFLEFASRLPIMKLLQKSADEHLVEDVSQDDDASINNAAKSYVAAIKSINAVADAFGVQALFVLQPIPTFMAQNIAHPFAEFGYGKHLASSAGYELLNSSIPFKLKSREFLNLSYMQQNSNEQHYVDLVHYNSAMADAIASQIVAQVLSGPENETETEFNKTR